MNRVIQDPTQELQLIQLGFFANSGGLPIVVNKQLIGVVGVGGSAPRVPVWSDEICAHKALTEVIGPSVPALVEDLPARPNPTPGTAPVPRFVAAAPPKSSLTPQFVIDAKAATTVFDANQISLTAAKKIARVCRDWAASKGGSMSLYTLNTVTGHVDLIGPYGSSANIVGLAFLTSVPEPSTYLVLCVGLSLFALLRQRRAH